MDPEDSPVSTFVVVVGFVAGMAPPGHAADSTENELLSNELSLGPPQAEA